jgi:hypothetical protein
MSNVNTDQRFVANDLAVLTPLTTSLQKVQFPAKSQYGTGDAILPLPANLKADGKRIVVRVNFDFVLATLAAQTLQVEIYAINSAGTATEIATTGAVALATQAGANDSGFLEVSMILDKNVAGTSGTIRGFYSGLVSTTLVAGTTLTNAGIFTYTTGSTTDETKQSLGWDTGQGFKVEAILHGADSTSSLTVLEFSVDVI